MIQLGVDLDCCDDDGFTALHHGVLSGFEGVVEALLKAGADVDARSLDYGTPLHLAALKARNNVATLLLGFRANVNAEHKWIGTPLHCASYAGDTATITTLLTAGADASRTSIVQIFLMSSMYQRHWDEDERWFVECTPLCIAVYGGQGNASKTLLANYGAAVNVNSRSWDATDFVDISYDSPGNRNRGERTALMLSAIHGLADVCSTLLEYGATVDAQSQSGHTALMIAAYKGRPDVLEILLDNKASIDLCDKNGVSAMFIALQQQALECVCLLLDRGASVNQTLPKKWNGTALHYAIWADYKKVIPLLLEKGADLEARDDYYVTPLHVAAELGDSRTAALLIARGAKTNSRDCYNQTPLHAALLDPRGTPAGTNSTTEVSSDARTFDTSIACIDTKTGGRSETVHCLIQSGANIDAQDYRCQTPLHYAVVNGRVALARYLVEKGADREARDQNTCTPFDLAIHLGNEEMIRAFQNDTQTESKGTNVASGKWPSTLPERPASIKTDGVLEGQAVQAAGPQQPYREDRTVIHGPMVRDTAKLEIVGLVRVTVSIGYEVPRRRYMAITSEYLEFKDRKEGFRSSLTTCFLYLRDVLDLVEHCQDNRLIVRFWERQSGETKVRLNLDTKDKQDWPERLFSAARRAGAKVRGITKHITDVPEKPPKESTSTLPVEKSPSAPPPIAPDISPPPGRKSFSVRRQRAPMHISPESADPAAEEGKKR